MELESWWQAVREAGRLYVPFLLFRSRSGVARPGVPPIRALRAQVLIHSAALLLIWWALAVLYNGLEPTELPIWQLWLVGTWLAAFSAGYVILRRVGTRRVAAATSPSEAVDAYRTRMFLVMAMAQAPALVAFVMFFLVDSLVPYLLSLPVSLALLAYGSPRVGDVLAVQEAIDAGGGSVDLAAALMTPRLG